MAGIRNDPKHDWTVDEVQDVVIQLPVGVPQVSDIGHV